MKKVERINTMMRYINNRSRFTISEIMNEFNISRSTAVRNIKEIEAMGMPLVTEVGRDGGYFVMRNSVLPAVRFTDSEIKALFLAFMATRNQQLPYLTSRQSLSEKLLGLISENQQDDLILLNQMLIFEGTNPSNPELLDLSDLPHPVLEQLIQLILLDSHLFITVKEDDGINSYPIYLLYLYREKSHWLIEGVHLNNDEVRVIRVDDLINVESYSEEKRSSRKQLLEMRSKQKRKVNLVIELGLRAVVQFKRYHPLTLSMSYTNPYQTSGVLKTFVDTADETAVREMIDWLLFLGEDIEFKEVPEKIIDGIRNRIKKY